jgi:hypothetical protein
VSWKLRRWFAPLWHPEQPKRSCGCGESEVQKSSGSLWDRKQAWSRSSPIGFPSSSRCVKSGFFAVPKSSTALPGG